MDVGVLGRILIGVGLLLALAGVVFVAVSRVTGGQGWRLPGDLVWRRDHVTICIPMMTSVLLSLILTAILWAIALVGRR